VNDCLAEARAAHFSCLGTLPLTVPEAALTEMKRSTELHGMRGFMFYSNAAGVPLADPRFEPLYAYADQKKLVIYIHPTYPLGVKAMEDYMLMPLVGFMFDTTLAASHLVFAGIPERYPNIRWVLGHLGGAIPYLAERLDRGYEAFERCRQNISRKPSEYLRDFYLDTVNFDPTALRMALNFSGSSRLLAGSDYPHMIGSIPKMLELIQGLELSPVERQRVLGRNAADLLGL
jgi:aminocarboxymuconate-semialdehyde decarboxylase